MTPTSDVVIIGTGHNGLVSGILLARAGLRVTMLEAAEVIGGATRTERPFAKVPGLQHSTGSYLLGLMPPGTPSPFGSTIHLLPGSDGVEPLARLRRMWAQVQSGQLPDEPTIENTR